MTGIKDDKKGGHMKDRTKETRKESMATRRKVRKEDTTREKSQEGRMGKTQGHRIQ